MLPAVILAAGVSSRMGRPKAVLPIGDWGEVFVTRLVATLTMAGVEEIVVVVGAHQDVVREALAACPFPARIVENAEYEQGQLSSLVAALDALASEDVVGLLAMPVDMPLVTPATARLVLDAYRLSLRAAGAGPVERVARGRALVVRPANGDRHGHPVIFDRALFGDLRVADRAAGARAVLAAHPDVVVNVPVDDPGAFTDIDTRDDYERHIGPWPFG